MKTYIVTLTLQCGNTVEAESPEAAAIKVYRDLQKLYPADWNDAQVEQAYVQWDLEDSDYGEEEIFEDLDQLAIEVEK